MNGRCVKVVVEMCKSYLPFEGMKSDSENEMSIP